METTPVFSQDWFSHHIQNWDIWLHPLLGRPVRALEIGCFEGRATSWLLANVLTHPEANITVIDTFTGSEEHAAMGVDINEIFTRFLHNTKPWEDKVDIRVGKSRTQLRRLGGKFDFVYIDGCHEAFEVLSDAVLVWPMMNPGGIVIFDDYGWNGGGKDLPEHKKPTIAIDAFLIVLDMECIAEQRGPSQVCLTKW